MTSEPYRLDDGSSLSRDEPRKVVRWLDGVVFRCPCSQRQCYIAEKNHTISFDQNDVMTLEPSIGSRPGSGGKGTPRNWCHFWLRHGQVELCGDAQCPGSYL